MEKGVISLDNCIPDMINTFKTKVMVNGRWIGIVSDPKGISFRNQTLQTKWIDKYFYKYCLEYTFMEISLLTDGGRCCRPPSYER